MFSQARGDQQMGSFLVELVSLTAGAAAGVVGTAAAGPVIGAAAATVVTEITGSLVSAFVASEDNQRYTLELIDEALQGRLARVESQLFQMVGALDEIRGKVQLQLEEPWKSALTYLNHAAEHDLKTATRNEYLRQAREKLTTAHSLQSDRMRAALIAQRLGAVTLMLGDHASARKWLTESYPATAQLVTTVAEEVERSIYYTWTLEDLVPILKVIHPTTSNTDDHLQRIQRLMSLRKPDSKRRRGAREFWISYIMATDADRLAARSGMYVRNYGLAVMPQVSALRRLLRMFNDLDSLRNSCLSLGADPLVVPAYHLDVDICPLAYPRIRLMQIEIPQAVVGALLGFRPSLQ